jgi:hypothetical protein
MKKIEIRLDWGTLVINEDESIDVLVLGNRQPATVDRYDNAKVNGCIHGNCFVITPGPPAGNTPLL